jgi:hypothetical protein
MQGMPAACILLCKVLTKNLLSGSKQREVASQRRKGKHKTADNLRLAAGYWY